MELIPLKQSIQENEDGTFLNAEIIKQGYGHEIHFKKSKRMIPLDKGTIVRLKADPGRIGFLTGKTRELGKILYVQVRFPDGTEYHNINQLEVIEDEFEDPIDLFVKGKFGRARDLRGNLTYIRLNGRLANLIYSMDTTNTDFYAYQFKPVLNFLESPSNGILIADEVGLGKTIEAGLIWTELRSRFDTRRMMVLCPSILQEKWQSELEKRFGIKADILKANDVLKRFKRCGENMASDLAIISSMQGLRPGKASDDEENINKTPSSLLFNFLQDAEYDEPLLNLLIIDESHYLRNPETQTAKLGRVLREIAEYIVLLSATPVHLKSRDLYQLLNLVDEQTFNQPQIFDDILKANEPLIKARDEVLQKQLSKNDFLELIENALSHPFLTNNRQLNEIKRNPPTNEKLKDREQRIFFANKLENINLLGKTVSRTRKREVTEWRVTREVVPEVIPMSDIEQTFYTQVTDLIREYAVTRDIHEGFLVVMPQRQMVSSMPAALAEWQRKRDISENQLFEDFGVDDEVQKFGPLVQWIISKVDSMVDLNNLKENDSKYNRLKNILIDHLKKYPTEKVIIFSYFRPTLSYLKDRFLRNGIESICLTGGDRLNKYDVIESFKDPDGPNVLLSSEVISEGVDLQFARILINYDLPWNPMKIEQRIGRIDRLGQKSPKVTIWNLFYENTIDERIYVRLYQRLDIFRKTLGELEAVLGEEIKKLTSELLCEKLNPTQEEERIEQTAQAIENIRVEEENLENEASNLVAHGEYILNQVNAARELQRYITGEDLWIFIRDFFHKKYKGCDFHQLKTNELLFDVKLSDNAKFDLDRYLRNKNLYTSTRLGSFHTKPIRCRFINKVNGKWSKTEETISQFHPLVRFVSYKIKEEKQSYYRCVSIKLSRNHIRTVPTGIYIFAVQLWSIHGVRDIEKLQFMVQKEGNDDAFLDDENAELLISSAASLGEDWLEAPNAVNLSSARNNLDRCILNLENKYRLFIKDVEFQNHDRADIQTQSIEKHRDRQIEKLKDVKQRHISRGKDPLAKATQGRIDALERRIKAKLLEIEDRRKIKHHPQIVCLGLINIM